MDKKKIWLIAFFVIVVVVGIIIYFTNTKTLDCTRVSGQRVIYKIDSNGIKKITYDGKELDEAQDKIAKSILNDQIKKYKTTINKKEAIRDYEKGLNSKCK